MQDKKKETKCEWCGRPVSRDAFGRARRFHPECGKAARSELMKGNKRSLGHGRPRELTAYTKPDSDPVKLRAYGGIPGERLREMAMAYWGEIGELCYFVFDHANPMLFDQDIPLPLFQVCRVMPYGKCVGQSYTSDVDRPVIDIFLSLWKSKYPYAAVAGVVMHEMLHFPQCETMAGAWFDLVSNESRKRVVDGSGGIDAEDPERFDDEDGGCPV